MTPRVSRPVFIAVSVVTARGTPLGTPGTPLGTPPATPRGDLREGEPPQHELAKRTHLARLGQLSACLRWAARVNRLAAGRRKQSITRPGPGRY